jgi:hypothetical protein
VEDDIDASQSRGEIFASREVTADEIHSEAAEVLGRRSP